MAVVIYYGNFRGGINMSGHSKWHNIQKTKGAADAKRAQVFTKIAREIIVAVKQGGKWIDPMSVITPAWTLPAAHSGFTYFSVFLYRYAKSTKQGIVNNVKLGIMGKIKKSKKTTVHFVGNPV